MDITIDISMYPLQQDYKPLIIDFVKALRQRDEIRIETNGVSTQVYGDYEAVMLALKEEMKRVFEGPHKVSMVMKIVNDDLSGPITF